MPEATPPHTTLLYFEGNATDILNDAFPDEENRTRAFRDRLMFIINTYASQNDQAGPQLADLVESLPYNKEFGHQDALIALQILRETNEALYELLEDDEEFKASLRGSTDDPDVDREVRASAREFSDHHDLSGKDAIGREARAAGDMINDRAISDSFYDGKSARGVEEDIHTSHRDGIGESVTADVLTYDGTSPGPASTNTAAEKLGADQSPVSTSTPEPPDAATRLFGEKPRRITVDTPKFTGKNPGTVFREAIDWLAKNLIAIASGTSSQDKFPRIAPIIDVKSGEKYSTTRDELMDLVEEIRSRFGRLRSPSGGTDVHDLLINFDPNNPAGAMDILRGLLGGVKREHDGEGWKNA